MVSVLLATKQQNNKMQISVYLLLVVVTGYHSFFIDNKDFKKLLQIFPKAFDFDLGPKTRPLHYRRRDNDYGHRDEYIHDNYDRNDNGENYKETTRNPRVKFPGRSDSRRSHYSSHAFCDHPDHHHHHNKYTEDRVEKQHNHQEDYYERKSHRKKKTETEKEHEEKEKHSKKDYITGVLVAIPKEKTDDLETYYKENKHLFLEHLLKAQEEERPHEESDDDDDIKSYLY